MYDDGYKKMINTDYSPVIIDLMRTRNQNCDGMSWEVMDINNLEYNEASFECILEKGTLDALLVDEKDPWKLSEENEIKLDKNKYNYDHGVTYIGLFFMNFTHLRSKL